MLSVLMTGWGALKLFIEFLKTPAGRWIVGIGALIIAFLAWGAWQKSAGRAEVRAEWTASVDRAKAALKADDTAKAKLSQATDDQLAADLARELSKRQEKYDALLKAATDAGCTVSAGDADSLRP